MRTTNRIIAYLPSMMRKVNPQIIYEKKRFHLWVMPDRELKSFGLFDRKEELRHYPAEIKLDVGSCILGRSSVKRGRLVFDGFRVPEADSIKKIKEYDDRIKALREERQRYITSNFKKWKELSLKQAIDFSEYENIDRLKEVMTQMGLDHGFIEVE